MREGGMEKREEEAARGARQLSPSGQDPMVKVNTYIYIYM